MAADLLVPFSVPSRSHHWRLGSRHLCVETSSFLKTIDRQLVESLPRLRADLTVVDLFLR